MLDDLIDQLQSRDAVERRQAIIALGRTKNPDALPALQAAFQRELDPELRELARKAGAYIRQQMNAAPAAPPPSRSARRDDDDDSVSAAYAATSAPASVPLRVYETPKIADAEKPRSDIPVRGREYNVSYADRKRAKGLIESALSANMRGDNARAMRDLAQALRLDPNLINDAYFGSIAASVTGTSGDEAVRMIVDGDRRKQFVNEASSKVKNETRAQQLAAAKQSTSGGVAFEFVIYLLINTVLPLILIVVVAEVARANFANIDDPELAALGAFSVADILPALGAGVGALIVIGVIVAVSLIVSTLFQTFMIHLAAVILGGTGTFVHLLDVLLSFYNRYQPILYVLFALNLIIAIVTLGSFVIACTTVVLVGFAFYFVYKTVSKIGEAYGTGVGMGCLTLLLATFIIALIQALLVGLLGNAIGGALANFIA